MDDKKKELAAKSVLGRDDMLRYDIHTVTFITLLLNERGGRCLPVLVNAVLLWKNNK
jgi:hypothetical protein